MPQFNGLTKSHHNNDDECLRGGVTINNFGHNMFSSDPTKCRKIPILSGMEEVLTKISHKCIDTIDVEGSTGNMALADRIDQMNTKVCTLVQ